MPNSSKDSQNGSTNYVVSSTLTHGSHVTSSSNQPHDAIFHVPIAQDPEFHVIFLINYLRKLWTKHHYMDTAPFRCICSASPCCIQELLIALGISKSEDIQLFSRRMECYLNDIGKTSDVSIELSGLTKKALKSLKSLKSGITSQSGSLKKERTSHGQYGK